MKTKHITLCGILIAVSLIIFIIENQIPALLPVPGIKLGLSNIIILFALLYLPPKETLLILVARILLSAVLTSAPSTMLYSLTGGLGCLITELILIRRPGKQYIVAISPAGAIVHNIFQLIVAFFVTQTPNIFFYLPILIISGIITGLFTGLCIYFLDKKAGHKIKQLL